METSSQRLQLTDNVIVPHPVTLELYRKMLTVFYIEERMKAFVRQGKCGFQASTRGHEKLQIGMTMLLKPCHDWFFTYYRSKAVAVGLGMPIKDIFLGMLGREGDPNSNGRNMPEQWSSRKLRLVAPTAVTGTQYLNAVGMARAVKADGGDEVVYVSSGEGATSEGEFFEALNWLHVRNCRCCLRCRITITRLACPRRARRVPRCTESLRVLACLRCAWMAPGSSTSMKSCRR